MRLTTSSNYIKRGGAPHEAKTILYFSSVSGYKSCDYIMSSMVYVGKSGDSGGTLKVLGIEQKSLSQNIKYKQDLYF